MLDEEMVGELDEKYEEEFEKELGEDSKWYIR
jgi:hypothetical protein